MSSTTVRDVMTTKRVISVEGNNNLAAAALRLAWQGCRHLPVTRDGDVVGILSEGDLLRWKAHGRSLEGPDALVRFAMSQPAIVATPDEDLAEAAARMIASRVGCLPVVLHGRLVGMLTTTDVLGHLVSRRLEPKGGEDVRAADVMTPNVLTASPDDRLLEAADMMTWRGVRHLPVVDDDGRIVGIVSERDMRTALGVPSAALEHWGSAPGRERTVRDVMTVPVECARLEQSLSQVIASMVSHNVGALPVVDAKGLPVGIISYLDALRVLRS